MTRECIRIKVYVKDFETSLGIFNKEPEQPKHLLSKNPILQQQGLGYPVLFLIFTLTNLFNCS